MSLKTRPSIEPALAKKIAITHDEGRAGVIARHSTDGPYVLVTHLTPSLLAVHFADTAHAQSGQPDFNADRPHAIVHVDALDTTPLWTALAKKPEHAAALSAAIRAARGNPWPS